MTIHADALLPSPRAARDAAPGDAVINWRSPARDLWIGHTADLRHAGMIERSSHEYVASDADGARLGVFPSLAEAECALVTLAQLSPSAAQRFPRSMAVIAVLSGAAAVTIAALGLLTLSS